ncbi:hypothetical protein [Kushneria konosiri]|uniref:hypothetical protein n=1 Tax=Kushneria konosiri TaxID=698828 RepID=UPI001D130F6C|nr:hypothetical protein [Kushneria konosiri]
MIGPLIAALFIAAWDLFSHEKEEDEAGVVTQLSPISTESRRIDSATMQEIEPRERE